MSCILNHTNVIFVRYCTKRNHVTRLSGKVHGNNRSGARGDLLFYPGGVDIQGVKLHISEHRSRTLMNNDVCCRGKGYGRGNDFVAGSDAKPYQGKVQSGSAGIHGHSMAGLYKLTELLLE